MVDCPEIMLNIFGKQLVKLHNAVTFQMLHHVVISDKKNDKIYQLWSSLTK